eukprot:CAMPEP_0198250852 /NCGR_PEP_ID=MMETSP1447-20131203/1877_1 /TAXON_ID=420782 /ORGANISM="Chaetoceros dichaeta, Strain CCMP1751" /LENGTH=559 /DNA_ID=CAMNT_0043935749 /DNA_START=109 /DNA_END=1788 /DNA_ORIENTATION=+
MAFQSGYQYSNIPNVDDPLSVSDNASTMTPNSGGQSHQQQQPNLPPELQAPSSMNPQQQQQQQQESYRPKVYNPTYHEYPQTDSWNNVGGSGMNAPTWLISSGTYNERRNRFMIGAVFIVFLFLVSHHHSEPSSTAIKGSTSANATIGNDGVTINNIKGGSNNMSGGTMSTGNKGVAGGNGVDIPDSSLIDSGFSGSDPDAIPNTKDPDAISNTKGDAISNTPNLPPTLTYLLTYPMSGTTYTVHLIEATTSTNTATNHDSFFVRSNDLITSKLTTATPLPKKALSSSSESNTSPFWHNDKYALPTTHILTQTHCGGINGFSKVLPDYAFDHQCRTVHYRDGNTTVTPRKHWDSKKRTIHLIRDPFSNVVSRFHAWRWEQIAISGGLGKRSFSFHSSPEEDKTMFQGYCKQVDLMDVRGFVDTDDLELRTVLRAIPCGLEFMKYVSWHILADRMKRESDSMTFGVSNDGSSLSAVTGKSLTIYYEDYASQSKTNYVVTMMAEFLDLDLGTIDYSQRPAFTGGRTYTDYFTAEERDAVKQLFRIMLAHDKGTWNLLKVYF